MPSWPCTPSAGSQRSPSSWSSPGSPTTSSRERWATLSACAPGAPCRGGMPRCRLALGVGRSRPQSPHRPHRPHRKCLTKPPLFFGLHGCAPAVPHYVRAGRVMPRACQRTSQLMGRRHCCPRKGQTARRRRPRRRCSSRLATALASPAAAGAPRNCEGPGQRMASSAGGVLACPAVVCLHGRGLLCLTKPSAGNRWIDVI